MLSLRHSCKKVRFTYRESEIEFPVHTEYHMNRFIKILNERGAGIYL